MSQLRTISTETAIELEEKKSRFLGFLVPITQFEIRLEALKAEHKKASHRCTAFRRINADGQIAESAKDDGEPGGTAGTPMLRVLQGANLINVGAIVVRYFGGTKLGTGGLARAYGGAVKQAIDSAQLEQWHQIVTHQVTIPFGDMSEFENKIKVNSLNVLSRTFTETGVDLVLEGPEETVNDLFNSMDN